MTDPRTSQVDPIDAGPPPPPASWMARTARWLNRTFPRLYFGLSLLPRLVLARVWIWRLRRARAGHALSDLVFERYRSSDTVFVFGTGASINDYSEERWEVVRAHDSIGMNFFLLHDHVPTFHVMETVRPPRDSLLASRYRQDRYRDVPLIVKTQLSNLSPSRVGARIRALNSLPPDVRRNAYLSLDFLASGDTVGELENSYRTLARFGLWSASDRFLALTKRRGSVSYVINLAARIGYRRIVLCGVDLNHTEYFYDSRRDEIHESGLPVPENREPGVVHSTNDPDRDPITIQEVIMAIHRTILEPAGVELLVGSETSALTSDLPRYDWDNAYRSIGKA